MVIREHWARSLGNPPLGVEVGWGLRAGVWAPGPGRPLGAGWAVRRAWDQVRRNKDALGAAAGAEAWGEGGAWEARCAGAERPGQRVPGVLLPSKEPHAVDQPRRQIRMQTQSATMETQRVSHGNPKQHYL